MHHKMTICEFFKKNWRNAFGKKKKIPVFVPVENTSEWSEEEVELFFWINSYRADHGLGELTPEQTHWIEASKRTFYLNELLDGKKPKGHTNVVVMQNNMYKIGVSAGENLGYAYSTPHNQFLAWVDSPGHEKFMRKPTLTWIGISIFKGNQGHRYYVMVGGKQRIKN